MRDYNMVIGKSFSLSISMFNVEEVIDDVINLFET